MKYIYFQLSCYSNFNQETQETLKVRYLICVFLSNYFHLKKSPEGVIFTCFSITQNKKLFTEEVKKR